MDQNTKVRERQASDTSTFLQVQRGEMQKKLVAMEQQVSAFKAAHSGELPHQQESNLSTLEQLNVQLQINSDKQTRVAQRLSQLEDQLSGSKMLSGAGPSPSEQLQSLRVELANLRKQYSEKYPDVVRVKFEIEALEEIMDAEPPPDDNATNVQTTNIRNAMEETALGK